ncbi:MAG: MFS transporter, partial [Pseudomonadota bacterium]|nr:MFS transporter [Pseudomonadota bacterium]
GALGRLVPAERRSAALALASTGGSTGQFLVIPYGQYLIDTMGWSQALLVIAGLAALMSPLALFFSGLGTSGSEGSQTTVEHGLRHALREAIHSKSFWYLNIGFGVCGFQVLFIAVHFPAYIVDVGLPPQIGALALALIGFFNILGTMACGYAAPRFGRKYLLSGLYVLRSVTIAGLLTFSPSIGTVLVVASVLGLLWLGTVPVTGDLVANLFGARYMSSLFGIVFLSHQIGGFVGVWAGGLIFGLTHSYDAIWYTCIGLGIIAGIVHLPISERRSEPHLIDSTPTVGGR